MLAHTPGLGATALRFGAWGGIRVLGGGCLKVGEFSSIPVFISVKYFEASFNADIVSFASLYSDTLFAHNFRLVIFLDFRNRAGHARRLRHFDFTLRKTWN